MDEQKIKDKINWWNLLIIIILVGGGLKLSHQLNLLEETLEGVSLNARRAYVAANDATSMAEEAKNEASDAASNAEDASNYAANCPGN